MTPPDGVPLADVEFWGEDDPATDLDDGEGHRWSDSFPPPRRGRFTKGCDDE